VSFAAIVEPNERFRREEEALWPDKFPLPLLEQIR
jgi:hypothetical protein